MSSTAHVSMCWPSWGWVPFWRWAGDYSALFNSPVDVCLATTKPAVVSVHLAFIQRLFYITINHQALSLRSLVIKVFGFST